jgi:hypothetical protein
MRKFYKSTLAIGAAGLMIAGLAACSPSTSTEDTSTDTESSAPVEADPEPLASIPALSGVDTQVTLDQSFLDAATGLGLTLGLVGNAALDGATLSFPITGGNVDYYDPAEDYRPYVQGEIDHAGSGISLTAGGTVVELTDFVIDPGTSRLTGTVSVNGTVAAEDVFIFNLDGTTLKPLATDENGNAVLEGTRVLISEDAAPLLNDTFGTDAIQPDMLVGIAKITAAAAS